MSLDEDTRWLEWVTKQFESIAGEDKEIDLDEFKTALKVKESFFAERFFALFDSDGSGSISLDELLKALNLLIHGSETDKLRFLFQVYDVDGSGSIDPDELKTVLKSCLSESAISLPEEKLDDLTLALFESADKDNSGSITFEELKAELETFPEVMENLTISAANWLKPPDQEENKRKTPRYLTRAYWHNNSRKLFFLCLYALLNILLCIFAMLKNAHGGPWFMVAKGCGQCLNLNCTFIIHDGAYQMWEYLLTIRPGIGWVNGTASVTGVVLQVLICFMVVTHLVIKRPPFFHFKPGDYVYINIPVIAKYEWHPFTISSAPEQQDTLWLHIRSMGQWTNRLYEYFRHPESQAMSNKRLTASLRDRHHQKRAQSTIRSRTVASNKDDDVELTLYQSSGTRMDSQKPDPVAQAELGDVCLGTRECYVDGPFGTPTRQIFTSEHAVLIGAGIGITPFASILQSIVCRYRMRKQNCPKSPNNSRCETTKDNEMKLRKVDFIWINRDQKSFEWFVSLLTKLEMDQADEEPEGRFLEMHMYMTSALSKNDMKAIGLQMALDLLAKKEKRDSITGLRTRTQPGRPDWAKVFQKVSEEKKGKVHVFYCGSPALAKDIKAQCEQFGFNFYKENF
ncbi:NADPH oxidase 5 [Triplophysa tibetana]|uniref:NADPH oxidase 5 n=1 Tax=Triplophysa tibetana TaxID=1572043 RepID=A0A5A9PW17_9TELE|nr:NADPH oxidase 5 [Triplophysa tibetana]